MLKNVFWACNTIALVFTKTNFKQYHNIIISYSLSMLRLQCAEHFLSWMLMFSKLMLATFTFSTSTSVKILILQKPACMCNGHHKSYCSACNIPRSTQLKLRQHFWLALCSYLFPFYRPHINTYIHINAINDAVENRKTTERMVARAIWLRQNLHFSLS